MSWYCKFMNCILFMSCNKYKSCLGLQDLSPNKRIVKTGELDEVKVRKTNKNLKQ